MELGMSMTCSRHTRPSEYGDTPYPPHRLLRHSAMHRNALPALGYTHILQVADC